MLELVECECIANQINNTCLNKKIVKVVQGFAPHKFAFFSEEDYNALLLHKCIDKACAIGGMIELYLNDIRLLLGDGVNIRYYQNETSIPKKHQLLLIFDDHSCLVCSVQMYGGMWAFKAGTYHNKYYTMAKEKPSVYSDEFNEQYFMKLYDESDKKLSLKAFLATEQRIPGLGNGCLQDILLKAGMHPKQKLMNLNDEEKHKLYLVLKEVLEEMKEKGCRDTEKDLFGNVGQYHVLLSSKTYRQPCEICGNEIVKANYLGGSIYYCVHCQKIKE